MPITAPATLWPEFPVLNDSSLPPRPRSSSLDVITIDLPITEWGPINLTNRSSILTFATPSSSATILPERIMFKNLSIDWNGRMTL